MRKVLLGAIVLVAVLSACRPVGRVTSTLLTGDVASLLAEAEVRYSNLDCRIQPDSRAGHCTLTLDEANRDLLIEALSLAPADAADMPAGVCSGIYDVRSGQGVSESVHAALDRPVSVPGMEYFVLYYNPQSDTACMDIQYAYG